MVKTVTNSQVALFFNYVANSGIIEKKGLPLKLLWAINRNVDGLSNIFKGYQEIRQSITNEFMSDEKSDAVFDAEGNPVTDKDGNEIKQIKDEFMEDYTSKMKELNEIDNEVDVYMVKLDAIQDVDFFTLSDISTLSFMIEE